MALPESPTAMAGTPIHGHPLSVHTDIPLPESATQFTL